MEKKNIYQKLAESRVELQEKDLKKSGHNKFANFYYYELGDFLPKTNVIFKEKGLLSVFNINTEKATLTIFDSDSKDTLVFESHIAQAQLGGKNGNPIQELGALHTYMKRYLFLNALEIVEHDQVDSVDPKEFKPKQSDHDKMRDMFNKKYGEKTEQVLNWVAKELGFGKFANWKPEELTFDTFKNKAVELIKAKQQEKDLGV